jgi:putative nucleotidyltransferase with HDIG domain
MENDILRIKIYSKIDELPTLPMVLPKLLNLMESSRSDASDIAEAVSHDPALTSKILKVANSAYYGFSQEISTLQRAVPLLGFNMVRSLALSIGVMNSLPASKSSSDFSIDGLWIHSLAVATAIRELSTRLGKQDENESLFVIGLLHDIGKVVLNLFFSEKFANALEEAKESSRHELHMAERRIIGLDHGEVGGMLLTRWRFPEVIRNPIACHHHTELPEEVSPFDVAVLKIANAVSQEVGLGVEGNPVPPEIDDEDLEITGIDATILEDIKVYLRDAEETINELFSAMT